MIHLVCKTLLTIFFVCCLSISAWAQNISIPGITGVDFDTTGGDYTIAFNSNFNVHGIAITASGLTLSYSQANETLTLYGTATASMDGESIAVGFGTDSSPGLIITNGALTQVSLDITTEFMLRSLTMEPENLGFQWKSGTSEFSIFGSLKAALGSDTLSASLGDIDSPGISILNGDITSINMSITADFEIEDLSVSPDDLTFVYSEADTQYEIYGNVTVGLDGNDVNGTLGDEDNPGFVIDNGSLSSFNVGVTGTFDLKAITITTNDLTFQWDSANSQFEMFGSASTSIDGNDIDISLGNQDDPGIIVSSGNVTHINFGVTADFDMKGITISPDALTLEYDSGNTQFEFYGSVSVKFDGEEVDASLGDADDPGIVYDNGSITHVNFGLTADFNIKSLSIAPDNLTFQYDSSSDHFEMFGDLTFKIGTDEVTANMGDTDDPGLIYKNNSVQHVNIGVTSDFSVSGLKIKTTDVGVDWNSGSDYHLFGDANLSIENETVDVDFGTNSDPGMVIRNGHLHSFEVDVNSDLKLGNLEVETKDLDIKYQSSKFEVTGEMSITEVFSLSVTLGEGDQAGLEIDVSGNEPRFKVEALEIDIEHANLGAIDLKLFELKFNSNGIEESDVKVVFPQGWEVDADLKFTGNPAKINSIDIAYRADNLADAIEMFEGVQIALLEASVDNIQTPSELTVTGTIETFYGGGFTLDGKSATLLEMRDEVTISPTLFTIEGDVNVGAYRKGDDSWSGLLGEGDISLSVGTITYYIPFSKSFCERLPEGSCLTRDWTGVRAEADVKIPGDPLIEADATVTLDNHRNFDALLDVEFIVPHWVPFIGGKHYGSVDGAVRYKHGDLSHSYGAGWVRIKTFWHTYHVGARYNFHSRHVDKIGSGTIDSIQREIKDDQGGKTNDPASATLPFTSIIHTFEVPQPAPNSMLIEIDWAEEVDSALITVLGPEGFYELTRVTTIAENDSTTTPTLGYEENMNIFSGDTTASFILTTPSAFSEEEIPHAALIDGRYQVVISYPGVETPLDSVEISPMWQSPETSLAVTKNDDNRFEIDLNYWTTLPDSTILSFYVSGIDGFGEDKLIDHVDATNFDEDGFGMESLVFTPDLVQLTDTLYFYAIVEDGVNPPVRSEVSDPFTFTPDLSGTINFPAEADSLKEGLRIYIDENMDGSFDVASTGGLELFAITNTSGFYSITGLEADQSYEVRIVLPPGYRIVGGTDRFSATIINFDGSPIDLNIEIEAYTEAE